MPFYLSNLSVSASKLRRPQEFTWRNLTVLAIAATTVWLCKQTTPPVSASDAGVIMKLPDQIFRYRGYFQPVSVAETTILPSDTEFARKMYKSAEDDQILCSIVLSGAEKRSIHRPEICLPGQGWTIRSGEQMPVVLQNGFRLETMTLTLSRDVQINPTTRKTILSYYIYWFVGQDKMTPQHWRRIFLTSWDLVAHNRNHRWAYVIVSSMVTEGLRPGGKSAEQTLQMLQDFIRDIAPCFLKPELITPPAGGSAGGHP